MPTRTITLEGRAWRVMPSGRVTQYDRDEFALLFICGTRRRSRSARHALLAQRHAFARSTHSSEMSDADLARLFEQSQPSEMSPEAGYVLVTTPAAPASVRRPSHAFDGVRRFARRRRTSCARRKAPDRSPSR